MSLATASELDIQLQALLKDLVMTQPEVVIPEVQLHCKELMVNFNRYSHCVVIEKYLLAQLLLLKATSLKPGEIILENKLNLQ